MKRIFLSLILVLTVSLPAFAGGSSMSFTQTFVNYALKVGSQGSVLTSIEFEVTNPDFSDGVTISNLPIYCSDMDFIDRLYLTTEDGTTIEAIDYYNTTNFLNDEIVLPYGEVVEADIHVDVSAEAIPGTVTCWFNENIYFKDLKTGDVFSKERMVFDFVNSYQPIEIYKDGDTDLSDEILVTRNPNLLTEFTVETGTQNANLDTLFVQNFSDYDLILNDVIYQCSGIAGVIDAFSFEQARRTRIHPTDSFYNTYTKENGYVINFYDLDVTLNAQDSTEFNILINVTEDPGYTLPQTAKCGLVGLGIESSDGENVSVNYNKVINEAVDRDSMILTIKKPFDSQSGLGSINITAEESIFPDLKITNKHYYAINYLYSKEVVKGFDDGLFRPENKVTRAELTKMLLLASEEKVLAKSNCFDDLSEGAWYHKYVCTARGSFIKGYDDGTFRPNQNVNRIEAVKMVLLSQGFEVDAEPTEGRWYQPYIEPGKAVNLFFADVEMNNLDETITRAEMSQMILNAHLYRHLSEVELDDVVLNEQLMNIPVNNNWTASKSALFVGIDVLGQNLNSYDRPKYGFIVNDTPVQVENDDALAAYRKSLDAVYEEFEADFSIKEMQIGDYEVLKVTVKDGASFDEITYLLQYETAAGVRLVNFGAVNVPTELAAPIIEEMIEGLTFG
jgi:hypothetical protein